MELLKDVFLEHAKRYRIMHPQDAIKLVYQNEFGGGHLISDAKTSLKRLIEEAAEIGPDNKQPLFEDIGNDICRVNLSPYIASDYSLSTLNRLFVASSNLIKGCADIFKEKLDLLCSMVDKGVFSFSPKDLYEYLDSYRDKNFQIPRHSDIYRNAYKPAYRVISKRYLKHLNMFNMIEQRLNENEENRSVIMAIDGRCGSGKTSLSKLISEVYDCNVIHMDDFFLPPSLRTDDRLNEAGGNIHYERFKEEIIDGLLKSEGFEYRAYDCSIMAYDKLPKKVFPKDFTVIEGTYSHHPQFTKIYDLKVFTSCSYEEQLRRIRNRDGAVALERFIEEWIPMEEKYFATFNIPKNSDLVLSDL